MHAPRPRPRFVVKPVYALLPALALLIFGFSAASQNKPAVPAMQAAFVPDAKNPQTILIQEEGGTIVGQMAKISAEHDQMTEIRTAGAQKQERKTLLSIIGKY